MLYLNCGPQSYHLTSLEGGMQVQYNTTLTLQDLNAEAKDPGERVRMMVQRCKMITECPWEDEREWAPLQGGWDWPDRG